MRRVFIVLAKLVGIILLYRWLIYFSSGLMYFSNISNFGSNQQSNIFLQIIGIVGSVLIGLGVGWVLVIKTCWLADKLGVKDDDLLPDLSMDVFLRAGFKLIGMYIFLVAMPLVFTAVYRFGSYGMYGDLAKIIWAAVLPAILQVVLALFLMIRTDNVLRLLEKGEKIPGKLIIVG